MESTKVDFTGQQVYVGNDVAKKSWKVCMLVGGSYHRQFSLEPDTDVLVRYLRRTFLGAEYQCVYKAGYCGFWICWQLREWGIECLVVNPADVPTSDKERRVKTDRIDAAKLARHLRSHELHSNYIPDHPAQEDRTLVRTRARFVRKQTRCKNQIKSLLSFYGLSENALFKKETEILLRRLGKKRVHFDFYDKLFFVVLNRRASDFWYCCCSSENCQIDTR